MVRETTFIRIEITTPENNSGSQETVRIVRRKSPSVFLCKGEDVNSLLYLSINLPLRVVLGLACKSLTRSRPLGYMSPPLICSFLLCGVPGYVNRNVPPGSRPWALTGQSVLFLPAFSCSWLMPLIGFTRIVCFVSRLCLI